MKRIVLIASALLLSICSMNSANAQGSNTGIGLRFTPDGIGATGKFFIDRNWAIEAQINAGGVLALEGESFNVVGLAQYHVALPEPSFRLFFGGGLHFGVWDHRWERDNRWRNEGEPIFGIDGVIGVEYVFKTIPLGLSFDVKPAVNFASEPAFFPHNMVGIAGRFYF